MKKAIIITFIFAIICFSTYAFAKDFSDVPKDHWAYKFIDELSNNNIINGYDDNTYKPNNTVTRAQVIKLLVCTNDELLSEVSIIEKRYPELPEWHHKYDLAAAYVTGTVLAGENYGLIPYLPTEINETITRKEVAYLLYCYARYENILDFTKYDLKGKEAFTDISDCEDEYIEAIDVVKNLGIITGYQDGSFKPNGNITRAELSKVLAIYTSLLKGGNTK